MTFAGIDGLVIAQTRLDVEEIQEFKTAPQSR
jgi:hypothetical protein